MTRILDIFGRCPPVAGCTDFRTGLFLVALAAGESRKFEQVVAVFAGPAAFRLEMRSRIVHIGTGIVGQVFKFRLRRQPPACGAS